MSRVPAAADWESHLIKAGMMAPKPVCLAYKDDEREELLGREEGLDRYERLIEEDTHTNHHVFYDLGVAVVSRPLLMPKIFKALDEGRIHCTKIRNKMIDNATGDLKYIWNEEKGEFKKQNYSLFALMMRHFGVNLAKEKTGPEVWRLKYHTLEGVPISEYPESARTYPIGDVRHTRMLHERQQTDIDPLGNPPGYEDEMKAAWSLNLMGTWGFRTDKAAVREYEKELQVEYKKLIKKCQEWGFRRGGGVKCSRDMKAIKGAVEKWYRDNDTKMKLTKTELIATDREQLTDTDHPGLHAVADSVKVEKLLTTYVSALYRGTEVPMNPSYNSIIETFRTSCSGGMKIDGIPVGMNLQNMPRGGRVRQCVIPREGWVFGFVDFNTLEMLTLAQVCLDLFGFSEIAKAAWEGEDFHSSMAADMLGEPYRDFHAKIKAGDKKAKETRQFNKISNYGFAGGMGWRTFIKYAKGFGVTVNEELAQKLHGQFRSKWIEMPHYFRHISYLCRRGRAEQIIFPRTGMCRGDVPYAAACNGEFQHLAAKGAKDSTYEVARECYVDAGSPLFGCRPFLFAHDEIGMEIPYDAIGPKAAHEAMVRLEQIMVKCMKHWCPDVPIAASGAMARKWHKGADAVYVDGLMVPSKPEGKGWVADL